MFIAVIKSYCQSGFTDVFELNEDGYLDMPECLERPRHRYCMCKLEDALKNVDVYFDAISFHEVESDFNQFGITHEPYNVLKSPLRHNASVITIRKIMGYYGEIENYDDIKLAIMTLTNREMVGGGLQKVCDV